MGGSILSGLPYDWIEGLIILFSVCVLLVLVIILSMIKKIGIGREFAYAILKGGVQLFVIALFLTFLFDYDLWYLVIWVLLVSMVLIGGYTSAKSVPGNNSCNTVGICIGFDCIGSNKGHAHAAPVYCSIVRYGLWEFHGHLLPYT
jgi:hypothetical protein